MFFNWEIAKKSHKYFCGSLKFDSCMWEKLFTARTDLNILLNKRDELVAKFWHRKKFTLKCFKDR